MFRFTTLFDRDQPSVTMPSDRPCVVVSLQEGRFVPRFVILIHDDPFLHWDLLLESSHRCKTWRLLKPPDRDEEEIPAEQLPDHRLAYLDYEGPVSGNRGTVIRWDYGTFEWVIDRPELYEVQLYGERWKGRVRLEAAEQGRWICHREPVDIRQQIE